MRIKHKSGDVIEKKAPRHGCNGCKRINNEIDEETGHMKCVKNCPYMNTISLLEKWM
jgi:hypothetical protein